MTLYFAYGSNMDPEQMVERLPRACCRGRGRLLEHRFACNKIGRDGSAKANVTPSAGASVWGVVWELVPGDLRTLDEYESGYRREIAAVELDDGDLLACQVYLSDRISDSLLPSAAYRERMIRGALRHGLPDQWISRLQSLAAT